MHLDLSRSEVGANVKGASAVNCVFLASGGPKAQSEVGSIELVTYPSGRSAAAAINAAVSAETQLGVPVTRLSVRGEEAFAQKVPDGWTCAVVSAVHGAEATLTTASSASSADTCDWAWTGLQALVG
ncbi:MAG TPA: hypothetical protein VNF50_13885 [Acidimicrobiales bacterium]|nr:hypothetical protein [Acidimicrobiales bacterium]